MPRSTRGNRGSKTRRIKGRPQTVPVYADDKLVGYSSVTVTEDRRGVLATYTLPDLDAGKYRVGGADLVFDTGGQPMTISLGTVRDPLELDKVRTARLREESVKEQARAFLPKGLPQVPNRAAADYIYQIGKEAFVADLKGFVTGLDPAINPYLAMAQRFGLSTDSRRGPEPAGGFDARPQGVVTSPEYPITAAGAEITPPQPSGEKERTMLEVTEPTYNVTPLTPVSVGDNLIDKAQVAVNELNSLRRQLDTLQSQTPAALAANRSDTFVGFVREYKFKAGKKGESPHHRFYIEADRGIWLYSRCTSQRLDSLLAPVGGMRDTKDIVGAMVICRPVGGMLVPVGFAQDARAEDRNGNKLYIGAPVFSFEDNRVRQGKVVEPRDIDGDVRVTFEDQDDPTYRTPERLVRAF